MRPLPILILTLILLLPLVAVAADDATPADASPLNGRWVLNEDQSDELQPPRAAQRPGGRGGRGGRGGAMGGRGRGMGGAGGSDQRPEGRDASAVKERSRELGACEIFLEGDEFALTGGLGVSRTLTLGGPAAEVQTPRGTATATARRDGDDVVLEETGRRGGTHTRRLRWRAEDDKLLIIMTMPAPGGDGTRTMTLVYDRG